MENFLSGFNFLEILVFIMLGLLFFKEGLLAWVSKMFGYEREEESDVPIWARQLQLHYNEETTQILNKILDKLGVMHDCLKRANTSLDIIKEYGVKIGRN